jgi:uncharacterized membrane protein
MNWFQRYGIPGAYFCGLSIVWFAAFYHCHFRELIKSELTVKIFAGVLAGSFLPVGYLLSVIGQIFYHVVPGIGIDTRARARAQIKFDPPACYEWQQEAITVYQIITTTAFSLDQIKWLLEWMSKRMDMVVINSSLILALITAPLAAWLFPQLFGVNVQIYPQWFLLSSIISVCVFIVSSITWLILTEQQVKVLSEALKFMAESRI